MDRAVSRAALVACLSVGVLAASGATPASGALPPRHGGVLTLPAPELITDLDPARVRSHFEATLVEAIYDGLYELRPDGSVAPVLAEGRPEREGNIVRVRLRRDVRHHGGSTLTARHVVRSIQRMTTAPESSWLLGAFEMEGGRPAVRELDEHTVEMTLSRRATRVDILLAATPFRVVVGGSLRRRPLGTGPFRARVDGEGGVDLGIFRFAVDRAPWMNRVRFVPPRPRDAELRAFELGELDGSWQGRSLYGREPTRPITTAAANVSTPWLLVPNRARVLRDDGAWGAVARGVDRRRLERAGLVPRRTLSGALPEPTLPGAGATRDLSLRLLVHDGRPLEGRIAEALAGTLDERGVRVSVERLSEARYDAEVLRGRWDLRLAVVRPPLPGRGPMVGAAFAAAGQIDRARELTASLADPDAATAAARDLGCVVLGHQRVSLHHRADLVGLRIDELGRLDLPAIARARRPEPFR